MKILKILKKYHPVFFALTFTLTIFKNYTYLPIFEFSLALSTYILGYYLFLKSNTNQAYTLKNPILLKKDQSILLSCLSFLMFANILISKEYLTPLCFFSLIFSLILSLLFYQKLSYQKSSKIILLANLILGSLFLLTTLF